jgi:hypothetical protein
LRKIISVLIIGILIFSGLGAFGLTNEETNNVKIKQESISVSNPIIKDEGQYLSINIDEATTITEPGKPMLPEVIRVFTFPFKTKITSVDVTVSEFNEKILSKQVQPVPQPEPMSTGLKVLNEPIEDLTIYENSELFPSTDFNYIAGSGLQKGEHVLILVLKWFPVRYSPTGNMIYYSKNAEIKITYEEPISPVIFEDVYDMVIIAPSEFSSALQPLIDHKISYGVQTVFKSAEEIYSEYDAYDEEEEIKYFIKDAVENWGVEHVLMVGSVDILPIRTSYAAKWVNDLLTDLYFADLYDDEAQFCSWDANGNGKYGEVQYIGQQVINIDEVDIFPDVNIGRLACFNTDEVNIVTDKIIYYETNTYGKSWFNNILLVGGDTFPFRNGNEGENLNNIIEGIMSDFTPIKLWTSDWTFNSWNLNSALNDNGAGFFDYSGHGFENGLGTHPPNSNLWVIYYARHMKNLHNGHKLPVVFFDACLTSRLDYNSSASNMYRSSYTNGFFNNLLKNLIFKPIYNILSSIFNRLNPESKIMQSSAADPEPKDDVELKPCFSWKWLTQEDGGGIATIGATRTAFGGTSSGAGKMSIEFFSAYENSDSLGRMMSQAQFEYKMDVNWDFFTIEEFILLGDPSLKIGGYP